MHFCISESRPYWTDVEKTLTVLQSELNHVIISMKEKSKRLKNVSSAPDKAAHFTNLQKVIVM